MDKKEIVTFFDSLAASWDTNTVMEPWKIEKILNVAEVSEGKTILDVACGTGILIPYYIARNVKRCVAIDISSKMVEIAQNKFHGIRNVHILCADAETFRFDESFDSIVIYNAFPHFANRTLLYENLSKILRSGGRITIAHAMGIATLSKHHSGAAASVSTILPEADELAKAMQTHFDIDTIISTDEIYIVSGIHA